MQKAAAETRGGLTVRGSRSGEAHIRCEGRRCKTAASESRGESLRQKDRAETHIHTVGVLLVLPGFSETGKPVIILCV